MKSFIKNTISIFLAILVLGSTFSFTVSEHYCGKYLVDTAIVVNAKTCGMEMDNTAIDDTVSKESCCKDIVNLVEGQEELRRDFQEFSFQQQVFLASFVTTYINLFEGLETNIVPFSGHIPPLIVKDIQVLDEAYLI